MKLPLWNTVQGGSVKAFGLGDGDGHYAYIDMEEAIGATIELIGRPKRRQPPEKVYPPP